MLSSVRTNLACLGAASAYVCSLYVFVPAAVRRLPRDDPRHIRYRMCAVAACSVFLLALLAGTYNYTDTVQGSALHGVPLTHALGVPGDAHMWLTAAGSTALLMAVFYVGPLLTFAGYAWVCRSHEVSYRGCRSELRAQDKDEDQDEDQDAPHGGRRSRSRSLAAVCKEIFVSQAMYSLAAPEVQLRALLVAPLTEEAVFRSLILVIMAAGSSAVEWDPWRAALRCPLWFAVAHAHHAATRWGEVRRNAGEKSSMQRLLLQQVVAPTLVQLAYTTIFGFIASLLYLRTGTLVAPVLSHVICNYAQLPDVSFLAAAGSASAGPYSCLYAYRRSLLAAHAAGIVAFALLVLPLTEGLSAASPFWP